MLAPKLRFKEFNDEWKKVKINKILKIKHGKNQKEIECINGKYPILGTGGIIGTTNTPAYLKESVLIGRKGTIDKPMYINIPFWTVDTLFYSDVSSKYNVKFIYYLFNTINWKKYDESTGVPSLSANTIENIDVNISLKKEEQLKISQFLSLVDKKIELQQRKIEVLKMYKRRQISYFFNKSTSYSTCLLKNICQNISSNISLSNTENKFGKYKLYGANGIVGTTSSPLVSVPYIAIIKDGAGVGKSFICESNSSFLSTMTGIVPTQCTVEYLKIILDSINFSKYIVGSGIPHIYFNDYKNEKIKLIPYKNQLKLSEFLCAINIKIETLNSKLHILKDFKKSLLQQMFI